MEALEGGAGKVLQDEPRIRAIERLCWSEPTCQIRVLADTSACTFADIHGDAAFHKSVDGVELSLPTM